jgi:hypothetical protein
MTVEHYIVAKLCDIKSISFQCDKCAYRVTMSPEDIKDVPFDCPTHHWNYGQSDHVNATPIKYFIAGLKSLRVLTSQQSLGFQILLEFDEPKAS